MYVRASDGSGQEKKILETTDGAFTVEDWSPDGRLLLFDHFRFLGPRTFHNTLKVVPVTGKTRVRTRQRAIWKVLPRRALDCL